MMFLKAEISVEGSDVMAVLSISYDQLVGPDLILFGEFRTADAIALSDGPGIKTFLGELGGMAETTGSDGCGCRACNYWKVSLLAGAGGLVSRVLTDFEM